MCTFRTELSNDHYIAPYVPVFSSGWEPAPLATLSGSGDSASDLAATIQQQANRLHKAEESRRSSGVSNNIFHRFVKFIKISIKRIRLNII